jgi:hypothetical protein
MNEKERRKKKKIFRLNGYKRKRQYVKGELGMSVSFCTFCCCTPFPPKKKRYFITKIQYQDMSCERLIHYYLLCVLAKLLPYHS